MRETTSADDPVFDGEILDKLAHGTWVFDIILVHYKKSFKSSNPKR